ncbi:MAG: hypothetical protein P1U58_19375 [Verrucomicrobiales bacterium]|nr:hypothetical protein [Verrucomicrobiales bacterium]
MKRLFLLLFVLTPLSLSFPLLLSAADENIDSELFEKTTLVYSEDFDSELNLDFWEVRQSSTWKIEDGILKGSESSKEFQAKKIAEGDKAHAGFKPVIWLKQVPAEFVCTMRFRYTGDEFHPRFPLLDLGHHFHTITFGAEQTSLRVQKDKYVTKIDAPLLPLGEWVEVKVELKKGVLLFTLNGDTHRFESEFIDMGDQRQIDFKGLDFGTCEIDWVRVWAGE